MGSRGIVVFGGWDEDRGFCGVFIGGMVFIVVFFFCGGGSGVRFRVYIVGKR